MDQVTEIPGITTGIRGIIDLPPLPVPPEIWVDDLNREPLPALVERASHLGIRYNAEKSRHHLVMEVIKTYFTMGTKVFADGILECAQHGPGMLRWARFNFRTLPHDIQVPANMERNLGLRNGNRITCSIRPPRDREKALMIDEVLTVEGIPLAQWREPVEFERLTATHPNHRIVLEYKGQGAVTSRLIDLIAPLGRGQRGLIIAPPRVGKTFMLKAVAEAILENSPETQLILLLVDERPEEVTDFKRTLNGAEIYSSTFDESPQRHIQVAELVGDRAKRLVEVGKHVVILLDSITRLSRGYNNIASGKGRLMSGGVDSKALAKPKKFFSAARNTEEAGSLTVVATCLVETNSKADDLIFEEYKGTGNMEVRLDRALGDQRIFPAISILQSATRRDDLLYHPREFDRIQMLRKQLTALPPFEQTQVLIHAIKNTHSNAELLLTGLR